MKNEQVGLRLWPLLAAAALLILAIALVFSAVTYNSPARAQGGGPVVLMGIDAEDGGPGGHGPISVYVSVANSILGQVTNGGSGILVIGCGKSSSDNVTTFWNAIGTGTGQSMTCINGASAISAVSFTGKAMIGVASDLYNTFGGGLTQAENDALATKQSAIANLVNSGGGLLGFSSDFFSGAGPYAYLGGIGAFTVNTNLGYSDITPTAAGLAIGITNALDICCWHDEYVTFPSFLQVLATNAATGNPAAIGGAQVVIPGFVLTPATATNPVGTSHTVTITVTANGNPVANVTVSFTVSGANTASSQCVTAANGQCAFTYTGANAGTDTITATATVAGKAQTSTASKTWVQV